MNYGDQRPPSKLHANWRGPYRVVRQDDVDLNRYTVQNIVTNKLEDFPLHQLKAYLDNGIDSPEQVAMTDDPRLHTVERIVTHDGSLSKPSSLRFRVKWSDLPENETSWESYNTIKNTETLHEYLNNLGDAWPSLIPIEFTNEGEHYSEIHPKRPQKRVRFTEDTDKNRPSKRQKLPRLATQAKG